MKVETRDFGVIEIDEKDVISFVSPIYGFDQYRKFVIINDISIGTDIMWLQSIDNKDICFVVVSPFVVIEDYNPTISVDQVSMLEPESDEELSYATIAVIPKKLEDATVNLKSPIVINNKNKKAMQIILEDEYPIRYNLYKGE